MTFGYSLGSLISRPIIPGGEHAVGLARAESGEVVDEDADVALSSVHDQGIPAENVATGVDSSYYALIRIK